MRRGVRLALARGLDAKTAGVGKRGLTKVSRPWRKEKGAAARSPQRLVTMRDFVADWKKWTCGERVLAVVVTLLMVGLPLGLLLATVGV